MTSGNFAASNVDAGSFRDREGRVYHFQKRVFRGLSKTALANFRELKSKKFYQKLEAGKQVVQTVELPDTDNPLPLEIKSQWAGFVEHQSIAVISYPYEWTFSMLKA